MDEAGITIVHGFGHFQVVVPTKYPSSIEVEKVEAVYTGEFINVESESESSLANRKKRAKKKRKMEDDKDLKSKRVKNNPPGNAYGWDEKETLEEKFREFQTRFQPGNNYCQADSSVSKEQISNEDEQVSDHTSKLLSNSSSDEGDPDVPAGLGVKKKVNKRDERRRKGEENMESFQSKKIKENFLAIIIARKIFSSFH